MPRVMLLVDGSDHSLRAVRDFVAKRDWYQQPVELQLLNVQPPIALRAGQILHIEENSLMTINREEGLAALQAGAKRFWNEAGVPVSAPYRRW